MALLPKQLNATAPQSSAGLLDFLKNLVGPGAPGSTAAISDMPLPPGAIAPGAPAAPSMDFTGSPVFGAMLANDPFKVAAMAADAGIPPPGGPLTGGPAATPNIGSILEPDPWSGIRGVNEQAPMMGPMAGPQTPGSPLKGVTAPPVPEAPKAGTPSVPRPNAIKAGGLQELLAALMSRGGKQASLPPTTLGQALSTGGKIY